MFPKISEIFSLLKIHPNILNNINRGIERETLRISSIGEIAQSLHPNKLGKPLTHPWITTDFSEALLELVTPIGYSIEYILIFLRDLHRYTIRQLDDNELLWSLSIPCFINHENNIKLAQYGNSNIGRLKTLYREGLKNRYGSFMQIIAGIHYNFSLPIQFWQTLLNVNDITKHKDQISDFYFRLIRNYHRFGWIIPYLFGASPAIYSSLLKKKKINLPFEKTSHGVYYLPYATSLRISDLGYKNEFNNKLQFTFNNLITYVKNLKKATYMPSCNFVKLGLKNIKGQYLQINTNILQMENEFYTPIRPKRMIINNELLTDALLNRGVEYIEVRTLDINPFTSIGIDEVQIYFLDLFLIWCMLIDSPKMNKKELLHCRMNWDNVIYEGRKPGQLIGNYYYKSMKPLKDVGRMLLNNLIQIIDLLDSDKKNKYYDIISNLTLMFENPELSYSGQILPLIIKYGINQYGLKLSKNYCQKLINESYELIQNSTFINKRNQSIKDQIIIEKLDQINFDDYLKLYNSRYNTYFKSTHY